jgi:hypothetical protein
MYRGDTDDLSNSVAYKDENFIINNCYTIMRICYTIHTSQKDSM